MRLWQLLLDSTRLFGPKLVEKPKPQTPESQQEEKWIFSWQILSTALLVPQSFSPKRRELILLRARLHGLAARGNLRQRPYFAESKSMRCLKTFIASLLLYFFASVFVSAQLPPAKDSLSPAQSGQSSAACSATAASGGAHAAAKILPQVMGPSPMEENLRRLTDEIGGRVTGSPQMAKAIEWAVSAFRAEGVEVHTEKYTLPLTWSEGSTLLVATEPHGPSHEVYSGSLFANMIDLYHFRAVSEGWSPATPREGLQGPVIDVGYGTEDDFARAGSSVRGAMLLVHSDIGSTWTDLFNEYLRPPEIIQRAVRGGASAILWMGARERLLLYRHTN